MTPLFWNADAIDPSGSDPLASPSDHAEYGAGSDAPITRAAPPEPIMARLIRMAICSGVVKHYKTDITFHDRQMLSGARRGDLWIWQAREYGSHLIPVRRADGIQTPAMNLEWFDAIEAEGGKRQWLLLSFMDDQGRGEVYHLSTGDARRRLVSALAVAA